VILADDPHAAPVALHHLHTFVTELNEPDWDHIRIEYLDGGVFGVFPIRE